MSKQSKRARFYARERVYRKAARDGDFVGFMPLRWARRRPPVTFPMEIGCVERFRFVTLKPLPANS